MFTANTGKDEYDIDRRHIVQVSVDKQNMKVLTNGIGLEWTPLVMGDLNYIAYISASSTRPPLPTILNLKSNEIKLLSEDRIPENFPSDKMVIPSQVKFKSTDGVQVYATKFEKDDNKNFHFIYIMRKSPPKE